jgi:hypothetical protein
MNPTLTKAVLALLLSGVLGVYAARAFRRTRAIGWLLELVGAAGLGTLGLAHVCESLYLLPWLRWGIAGSAGHYVNIVSVGIRARQEAPAHPVDSPRRGAGLRTAGG